jgi:YD repeat-containing protein
VRHPKFGSGRQTVRYYDADQKPDSLTDADGNKTAYVYDLANQQTQILRADPAQSW